MKAIADEENITAFTRWWRGQVDRLTHGLRVEAATDVVSTRNPAIREEPDMLTLLIFALLLVLIMINIPIAVAMA